MRVRLAILAGTWRSPSASAEPAQSDTTEGEESPQSSDGAGSAPASAPVVAEATSVGTTQPAEGWWKASDGKWYSPELHAEYLAPPISDLPRSHPLPQSYPTFPVSWALHHRERIRA